MIIFIYILLDYNIGSASILDILELIHDCSLTNHIQLKDSIKNIFNYLG